MLSGVASRSRCCDGPSLRSAGLRSAWVNGKMHHWGVFKGYIGKEHWERIKQGRKTHLEYCHPWGARMESKEGMEEAWGVRHDVLCLVPPHLSTMMGYDLLSVSKLSSLPLFSVSFSKLVTVSYSVCVCT